MPVCGNSLFRSYHKLRTVKGLAKRWAKEQGHSSKQVEIAKADLDVEVSKLLVNPSFERIHLKIKELQEKLKRKLACEEVDMRQRRKVSRLKFCDFNTRFFSFATKVKGSIKSISRLLNSERGSINPGRRCIEYFLGLFQSTLRESDSSNPVILDFLQNMNDLYLSYWFLIQYYIYLYIGSQTSRALAYRPNEPS